jgi:GNAT superfamily N-acetyltransferase
MAKSIVVRPLGQPGDLGWAVMAHGEVYAAEYGWDTTFEALVARIVADFAGGQDAGRQAAWVAEVDKRRAGCVFCVPAGEQVAQLRLLLVEPAARGFGLGGRLVDECVSFAGRSGYKRLMLWTNHPLVAAKHVYLSRGFVLTEEQPHRSFGVDLVGQVYQLEV